MSASAPPLPEAMRQIGALLQAGELRGAHDRLAAIVAEHPDCAEALRLLGGLRLGAGDPAGAEALLRRALALDPGWAPTLATLGELLLGTGRTDEAETLLRRADQAMYQAKKDGRNRWVFYAPGMEGVPGTPRAPAGVSA